MPSVAGSFDPADFDAEAEGFGEELELEQAETTRPTDNAIATPAPRLFTRYSNLLVAAENWAGAEIERALLDHFLASS